MKGESTDRGGWNGSGKVSLSTRGFRTMERRAVPGRFDSDFLHFLAHFSRASEFLSGRHIEQSISDIFAARNEKRTETRHLSNGPRR